MVSLSRCVSHSKCPLSPKVNNGLIICTNVGFLDLRRWRIWRNQDSEFGGEVWPHHRPLDIFHQPALPPLWTSASLRSRSTMGHRWIWWNRSPQDRYYTKPSHTFIFAEKFRAVANYSTFMCGSVGQPKSALVPLGLSGLNIKMVQGRSGTRRPHEDYFAWFPHSVLTLSSVDYKKKYLVCDGSVFAGQVQCNVACWAQYVKRSQ